jgi:hypothetical protein
VYVGYTNKDPKERFQQHLAYALKYDANWPISNALRKYPEKYWTVTTLGWVKTKERAVEKEKYWIKKYDSYGKGGYNATPGGDGGVGYIYERTTAHRKTVGERTRKTWRDTPEKFFTESHRQNLSNSQIGEDNNNFGKKAYSRGDKVAFFVPGKQPRGYKLGNIAAASMSGKANKFYGKQHTEDSIRKMLSSRRSYAGADNPASKSVKIGRRIFSTKTAACSALKITYPVLNRRLKSSEYPTYQYME